MRYTVLGACLLLSSCKQARPASGVPNPPVASVPTQPDPASSVAAPPDCEARVPAGSFNPHCASVALTPAREQARICGFRGHMRITFAPTGKVTQASADRERVDEETTACLKNAFDSVHIPPFEGSAVPVGVTIIDE